MAEKQKIASLIREIAKDNGFQTYLCTVEAVDGAFCTVKRVLDEKIYEKVRLNCTVEKQDGLVIVPVKGSHVLITNIDNDKWFVSQFSKVEKITLNVDDTIEINGGKNHGLVKVESLTQKLNTIEKDINMLKDVFKGWTAVSQDGGAALKTAAVAWSVAKITETKQEDIENDKIKH